MQSNIDNRNNTRINQHISSLADDSDDVLHNSDKPYKHKAREIQQHKLSVIAVQVRTIHIEHVACALHIIELTNNLREINVSETLKVIVGGVAVEAELLAACHALSHDTLVIENDGHKELFVTRKR